MSLIQNSLEERKTSIYRGVTLQEYYDYSQIVGKKNKVFRGIRYRVLAHTNGRPVDTQDKALANYLNELIVNPPVIVAPDDLVGNIVPSRS